MLLIPVSLLMTGKEEMNMTNNNVFVITDLCTKPDGRTVQGFYNNNVDRLIFRADHATKFKDLQSAKNEVDTLRFFFKSPTIEEWSWERIPGRVEEDYSWYVHETYDMTNDVV